MTANEWSFVGRPVKANTSLSLQKSYLSHITLVQVLDSHTVTHMRRPSAGYGPASQKRKDASPISTALRP
jgi:hypothetical protein